MIIKGYKFLSNSLSWVGLVLMMGISPIIQAATDCNAVTEISKDECESLLELYNSTNGANWTDNTGWNVTNTPCSWYGLSCINGGVEKILLSNNNLKGSIPDFSALPNLQKLDLRSNQLSGTIPDFSALPNLKLLDLSMTGISGTIPDFSALPNLEELYLSENGISGSIPDFSALPKLKTLQIFMSGLSGSIPDFSALPKLETLQIFMSGLSGTLPNFSALPNLQSLELSDNQLSGTIPDFSALPKLKNLSLSRNQLTGTIPNVSALTKLETLSLGSNQLTGTIPNFNALTKLENLSLEGNQLSGTIPDFSTLPNLKYLYLSSNHQLCQDKSINYGKWQGEVNQFQNCPHTLSISPVIGGSISRSPVKDNYNYNETVNLTANPEQCYKFTNWGGDCSGAGTSSSCQLGIDSDKSVTANFEIKSYGLTIETQGGKVTSNNKAPAKNYNCGSEVTLKAVANTGYNFVRWQGDASGSNPNISITMDGDKTITAIFESKTHNLSTSSGNGGSISRSPTKDSYNHNETVNLTANPEQCYKFSGWSGACSGTNSNCQLTMDSNKSVTANFEIKSFRLNTSSNNGSVERQPDKSLYKCNENVKLTAKPNKGYKFKTWDGDANVSDEKITINMDTDKNITAMFTKIPSLKISPNFVEMNKGETQRLTVTGGVEPYQWSSNGGELTPTSGNKVKFSANSANSEGYKITVTDNNGEISEAIVKIYELKVTPTGPLTLGFGETIKLTASGGRPKYNWTVTNGELTSKQSSSTTYIAPKIAGDNTITLTDDRGSKVEIKVKVIAELICSPTLVTVILGDSNPVTFKAAGGAEPYKWSADNGPINPIQGPEADYQPPAQTGEYHVTCKDNKDSSITALVRVVPSVAITPAQIDLATGEVATLQVTGGQKPYTWITKAGDLSSTSASRVSYTAPTRNGVYSVTVTDALKQQAKARIQVLGNLIISPIKTVVTIGENIHLSAARGAEPYTWPDSSKGRTWNTKFTQVGRQEVVVTDAAGDTGLAVVDIIHAELGLTPETASLHPSEVINFFVTGGTSPYAWSAEAGTLSNLKGQRVGYVAPEQPGEYTITVADGRDKVGQAKVTVTAGVTDSSGKLQTNRGAIRSGIIIDGVAHHSDHILTDAAAHIEISFPLTMPTDGQKYNTYGAILWTPPQAAPVFLFRTTNIVNPFQIYDLSSSETFPAYQTTSAGENVVIDIYRGALNGLTGQFNFYAGYAPTTATNVLDSLLFNSKPFILEVK